MAALMGNQKISASEAAALRERFAAWPGASGPFVAAEALRYRVNRETIRRILRYETHLGAVDLAAPGAAAPGAAPTPAFPWAGEAAPEAAALEASAAADADARRLLNSLANPNADAVLAAMRAELAGTPTPEPPEEPA